MEAAAHQTLELRALFRRLDDSGRRNYQEYLTGGITRDKLFESARTAGLEAKHEAMLATLGKSPSVDAEIDERIGAALKRAGPGLGF